MIPASRQASDARQPVPSSRRGYVDSIPLGPPPGIDLIDRAVNAALPHGPEWGKEKKNGNAALTNGNAGLKRRQL
jgi:hypothetical protein